MLLPVLTQYKLLYNTQWTGQAVMRASLEIATLADRIALYHVMIVARTEQLWPLVSTMTYVQHKCLFIAVETKRLEWQKKLVNKLLALLNGSGVIAVFSNNIVQVLHDNVWDDQGLDIFKHTLALRLNEKRV